jgi:replicative DNA helicase
VPDQQLPPNDAHAEKALLGSLLRWPAIIADVQQVVRTEDFYLDAHQRIFAAIVERWSMRGTIDLVTVAADLDQRGHVEDIGGYAYLAELHEAVATGGLAVHYAEIISGKAVLRRLIHSATEIIRNAYDNNGSPTEQLERAEQEIFTAAQTALTVRTIPLRDAVRDALAAIDERAAGRKTAGYRTGFDDLDELIVGLQPGELTIIAARPSIGKTTLGAALLRSLSDAGRASLFVSLEQSATEIAERMLANVAQVDSHRLRLPVDGGHRLLTDADCTAVRDAAEVLQKARVLISDSAHQSVARIATNARLLRMRGEIDCVFIDYLGLIEPEDRRAPRHEQVGTCARRLKMLAKELGVPVVCLAQLNRELENSGSGRPKLSHLRDSGEIEQHADLVILLHREQEQKDVQNLELIVAKNRNGRTGSVSLRHIRSQMRFESVTFNSAFPR